ncbi:hypothetical protein FQN57_007025 [Myotisia sp. PD_48]|nr:hypothetical protein FQN57_007025 [Myotisia sp. PD_48]
MSNSSSSISRAFTRRQKRPEVSAPMPFREGQLKFAAGTIQRSKISLPVELISTTNLLAYTAPDLKSHSPNKLQSKSTSLSSTSSPTTSPAHSASSSSSFRSTIDESDASNSTRSPSTTVTSADLSSHDVSPVTNEGNAFAAYFDQHKRSNTNNSHLSRSSTSSSHRELSSSLTSPAPAIPQRSLSHTKKSHQELVRQRSRSKMAPPSTSLSGTHAARMQESLDRGVDLSHPFGKELEQVNEVAEEFAGGQLVVDEDERALAERGLRKVAVDEYLFEVDQFYRYIFPDERRVVPQPRAMWI